MTGSSLFSLLLAYRYWILFPLAFIEGPVVAIAAGLFVSLHYLAIVPTYCIMLLGDLVPDMLYYWIGRLSHKANFLARYGHRFGISPHRLVAIEHLWHKHTFKSALLSKWAYGMSTPLLMSAGLARLPVKRYIICVVSITMLQYALLLIVGYYFGSSYQAIGVYLKDAGWIVAIGVIIFLIVYFFVSKFAKNALLRDTR